MTTKDFTIELFFHIDQELSDVPKHSQARLYPSEVITLAFLFALFNVLAQWYGLQADRDGVIHLSIAEFSL